MVVLIGGASHTGKTALAQRLLEKHGWPYLSIDHLKMGLIRSGQTTLTPEDDEELTAYLWPIVREMVKTAVENRQNLIVEGCYIPFTWREDFEPQYLAHIRGVCLIMSEGYISAHFNDILAHACDVEDRQEDDGLTPAALIDDNARFLAGCKARGWEYVLIDHEYRVDWDPPTFF